MRADEQNGRPGASRWGARQPSKGKPMFKNTLATLALGLAAAGEAHAARQRSPASFVAEAVRACVNAAPSVPRATAMSYCSCVLDGLQAKYRLRGPARRPPAPQRGEN